jgi:NAD(P)-dependent dehydrogenase (short-subunit alcohol dehydrogenase family)
VAALDDAQWFDALNQISCPPCDSTVHCAAVAQGTGVIVHVSSIQRLLPLPESTTAYAAARGGVGNVQQALSKEGEGGVRCASRLVGLRPAAVTMAEPY